MESKNNSKSMSINSAENALTKSITAFYLLDLNYPSEAVDCITQLWQATELILRERYKQEEIGIEDWNAYDMVQFFPDWNSKEKVVVDWVRDKRNLIEHTGEPSWEEVSFVKTQLLMVYSIIGKTYQSLGHMLTDIFTDIEQKILSGNELDWKDKSRSLAMGSFKYIEVDSEIAIDIANKAFEKAFRGYAKCCRIEKADILPLSELGEALHNNEYWFEADVPVSWEEYQYTGCLVDPLERMNGGDSYYYFGPSSLLDYSKIVIGRDNRHEQILRVRNELGRNRGLVNSLITSSPELDCFECVANSWHSIVNKLQARFPKLTIPPLKEDPEPESYEMHATFGISAWWDEVRTISIHFQGIIKNGGWEEKHTEALLEIITMICGEKPDDLIIEIQDDSPIITSKTHWIDHK
jgi:hypothetical protein